MKSKTPLVCVFLVAGCLMLGGTEADAAGAPATQPLGTPGSATPDPAAPDPAAPDPAGVGPMTADAGTAGSKPATATTRPSTTGPTTDTTDTAGDAGPATAAPSTEPASDRLPAVAPATQEGAATGPTALDHSDPAPADPAVPIERTTPSGLKIVDLPADAEALRAQAGDTVWVHYTGKLEDGTVFDTSLKPRPGAAEAEPFHFKLGSGLVIKGWDEGIVGMKAGDKRQLIIPAALAYGAEGRPPVIPPNATLIFDIELVGLTRSQ